MAKTKVLERKPLSFAEKTFIPQIVGGLKTTLGTMFDKTVTLQYPCLLYTSPSPRDA